MEFSDRLNGAIRAKQTRVMVGLDPHLDFLPPTLLAGVDFAKRTAVARSIETFCIGILDAVADVAAVVKPQVAFFERLGPAGYEALETIVAAASARDILVVSDCKRGDIGSTSAAYADYHLGSVEPEGGGIRGLGADAITVNPYFGEDSLKPFAEYLGRGRGIFILAKTSNKGAGDLQDRTVHYGEHNIPLYHAVASLSQSLADRYPMGKCGYSSVGLVVGATYPEQAVALRKAFPHLLFLIPGVGAQGAAVSDLRGCFDDNGLGAVVNSSRGILFAYRESGAPDRWQDAARTATIALRDQLNALIATPYSKD